MEKNQPKKLQRLMIRPIVSHLPPNCLVHDLQVLPDEESRGGLDPREQRPALRGTNHRKFFTTHFAGLRRIHEHSAGRRRRG